MQVQRSTALVQHRTTHHCCGPLSRVQFASVGEDGLVTVWKFSPSCEVGLLVVSLVFDALRCYVAPTVRCHPYTAMQVSVLMSTTVADHMMTGVIFSQLAGHIAAVAYDSETMFLWKSG